MLIDEDQRGDELALRVEQMHLRPRRHHVGHDVADASGQLVDELDGALAIAAHERPGAEVRSRFAASGGRSQGRGGPTRSASLRCVTRRAGPPDAGFSAVRRPAAWAAKMQGPSDPGALKAWTPHVWRTARAACHRRWPRPPSLAGRARAAA